MSEENISYSLLRFSPSDIEEPQALSPSPPVSLLLINTTILTQGNIEPTWDEEDQDEIKDSKMTTSQSSVFISVSVSHFCTESIY